MLDGEPCITQEEIDWEREKIERTLKNRGKSK